MLIEYKIVPRIPWQSSGQNSVPSSCWPRFNPWWGKDDPARQSARPKIKKKKKKKVAKM